jgi:hypothetical protein
VIDEVVADRAAALAALDGRELARRLALLPHVAAWCTGTGPLRVFLGASTRNPGRKQLAGALANPHVQRLTIELLDPAAAQLLVVIAGRGGSITTAQLAQELEPVAPSGASNSSPPSPTGSSSTSPSPANPCACDPASAT